MPSVISYIRKASTGIPSEFYFPILPKMLISMWEGTQPLCPSSHMTSNGEGWLR